MSGFYRCKLKSRNLHHLLSGMKSLSLIVYRIVCHQILKKVISTIFFLIKKKKMIKNLFYDCESHNISMTLKAFKKFQFNCTCKWGHNKRTRNFVNGPTYHLIVSLQPLPFNSIAIIHLLTLIKYKKTF